MLCEHCRSYNPDANKFCGACGAAFINKLPFSAVAGTRETHGPGSEETKPTEITEFNEPAIIPDPIDDRAFEPVAPKERSKTAISGSSFLGLNDSDDDDDAD